MTAPEISSISVIFLSLIGVMVTLEASSSKKRKGTYRRLDEVKKDFEGKHVSKEVCGILHGQLKGDILEIKSDVKLLLRKNGINNT